MRSIAQGPVAKAAGLLGVLAAFAVLAIAVAGKSEAEPGQPSAPATADALGELFPAFAEQRGPADAIPARLAPSLAKGNSMTPALGVGESRRVDAADDEALYLAPSGSSVCAVYVTGGDEASSSICAAPEQLEAGAVVFDELLGGCRLPDGPTGEPACEYNAVNGLAPGADSVELTLGDCARETVPVTGGVFSTKLAGHEYVETATPLK